MRGSDAMPRKAIPESVLALLTGSRWAITEDALQNILAIAQRSNLTPESVAAALGRPLENAYYVDVRDGVATIPIRGPMFRYANLFTMISGATSYELVARDFTTALEDPSVRAILFDIDSPGGEVNGVQELAALVYAARDRKPMLSFVSGTGASAAYWLASAPGKIIAGETAVLGSIGAVATFVDERDRDSKKGVRRIQIVSTQSPRKRLDPMTDEGRAEVQTILDDLAAVFVAAVARNRGVDAATVLAQYGAGGVFVGAAAVKAGLADRLGTFEDVHRELAQGGQSASPLRLTLSGGSPMPKDTPDVRADASDDDDAERKDEEQPQGASPDEEESEDEESDEDGSAKARADFAATYPQHVAAWRAEGAQAERDRLNGIDALAAPGREALIAECKNDPACTPEAAAHRILTVEESPARKRLAALHADEDELDPPSGAPGQVQEGATAAVQSITSLYHAHTQSRRAAAGRN